ncbi:MAG: hypothetical protein ACXU98_05980 [Syntrophales bacterium]
MISEEATITIKKALKLKYEEHVGRLLSIPESHLKKITPNRGLPIIEILEGLNADTTAEIRIYGEVLRVEVVRLLEKLNLPNFSEEDKKAILVLVEDYCQADLYINRFDIILDSIERRAGSYGISFDRGKYRIDVPRASCVTDAENSTRRIKAIIENELSCLVESCKSQNVESKDFGSQITRKNDSILSPKIEQVQESSIVLSILKKIWRDPVLSKVIAAIIIAIGGGIWAYFSYRTHVNQVTPFIKHAPSESTTPSNAGTNMPPKSKAMNDKKKDGWRQPTEIAKGANISLLLNEIHLKKLYIDLDAAESFLAAKTGNSTIAALERYDKVIRSLSPGACSQLDQDLLEGAKADEGGTRLDDAAAKYSAMFSVALVQYRRYQKEANR